MGEGKGGGSPWIPIGGESGAFAHLQTTGILRGARDDILRETGLGVGADGATFLTVRVLRVQVLGVDAAGDVEAVAMVGGHEDERLFEVIQLTELGEGCFDGVVELEEIGQGAVVVEGVHLLVDGRGFGHEEKAFVAVACGEDVDGLERHFFEARHVGCVVSLTVRAVSSIEILLVDVAIQPDGHV